MFYVEVQLDPTGLLCDVKVAHHGENPVVRMADKPGGDTLMSLEPLVLMESKILRGVARSPGWIIDVGCVCKDHLTDLSFSLSGFITDQINWEIILFLEEE